MLRSTWPLSYLKLGGAVAQNDPNFASVVLLLGFNSVNGSGQYTDESPAARGVNTITDPDPSLDTSVMKYGAGSAAFNGSSQFASWADSADWDFSNGQFTIEGWFRFDAAGIETTQNLINQWTASSNNRGWLLQYRGGAATNDLVFAYSTNGTGSTIIATSAWTPTSGQWYHIAVDRDGSNKIRIYIDGVMLGSATAAVTFFNSNAGLRIGSVSTGGGSEFVDGNMDEIRITKGVARYANDSGFTPPAAAFPRS